MVRLRLARMGRKKKPHYRIVAADSRAPRDGRFIEQLGYYNPMVETEGAPFELKLDLERIDHWLSVGAQPSQTVGNLIRRAREAAAES